MRKLIIIIILFFLKKKHKLVGRARNKSQVIQIFIEEESSKQPV